MEFTGSWSLPLFTTSGTTGDGGAHGYTGDFTLPLFTTTGAFDAAFNDFVGDFRLPLFTTEGFYLSSNSYTGDFRLPLFTGQGAFKNGNVFTGTLELPLWTKSGVIANPPYTGVWTLPLFSGFGRFEAPVTATFKTWPVNVKNGALTSYENFSFNSFARFNGEYLAAGAAGIFALSGDDDAGTDIDARIRFALTDLGIANLKRLEEALINYRSDGTLILRVVVDGGLTYEYPLEPTGKTGMYQTRVKTGKGLRVNFINLEISNWEGADFDLDSIRIRPTLLSRSIGGD